MKQLRVLLISTLLAIVLVEIYLEVSKYIERLKFSRQSIPFYSWSLEGNSNNPLSWQRGLLRIKLDPEVGYQHAPNQLTDYFSTNSFGFRGAEPTKGKDPVIFVTGGSFAFGTGLLSDRQTFLSVLGERFSTASIVNAAMIGHASGQEDLVSRRWFDNFGVKLLISIGGWNDFAIAQLGIPASRAVFGGQLEQMEQRMVLLSELENPNPIFRIFRGLGHSLIPEIYSKLPLISGSRRATGQDQPFDVDEIASEYVKRQGYMAERSNSRGAKFFTVLQPDINSIQLLQGKALHPDAPSGLAESYNRFCSLVTAKLAKLGIDVMDLNKYHEQFKLEYFMDSIHLNAEGHLQVAALLQPELNKRLVGP